MLGAMRMLLRRGSASIWINHVSFNTRMECVTAGSYGFEDSMLVKKRHCMTNDVAYEGRIANGESSALATTDNQKVDVSKTIKQQLLHSICLFGQRKVLYHCLEAGHRRGDVELAFEPVD